MLKIYFSEKTQPDLFERDNREYHNEYASSAESTEKKVKIRKEKYVVRE